MPPITRAGVALVDGGSFVLPYVHAVAMALRRRGHPVAVFASRTRYNGELLDHLRSVEGITVHTADVSGSVAPRWRGVLGYLGLLLRLWRGRRAWPTLMLQFAPLGLAEWPFWWLLRRRLVLAVHNAVPHDHPGARHRATAWLARSARALVFLSRATQADFVRRYGAAAAAHAVVMPHGLSPLEPGEPPRPFRPRPAVRRLVYWSTVKPYKGVELFEALARSPETARRGLALEVHGRWDAALRPLQARLRALGVRVDDAYLDVAALRALFAHEDALFVLPYRAASQSGALYQLLHQGCPVLCTDVGDLGDVMRRHGLAGLLLAEATPDALWAALDRWQADPAGWAARFAALQRDGDWDAALAGAGTVFDGGRPGGSGGTGPFAASDASDASAASGVSAASDVPGVPGVSGAADRAGADSRR
ncbi:glycosyltransferase [Piscinibacter sakaiensis]|uniref:Glycosyl transferase, group 1 n=1 Tax=Piscinibacter sakaiensis TaxID=1547922 RepID=A0A0K8NUA7_PISS1|nr:glycosyltransferase [Piscinibacter sakaiensis]GAP33849.1 glycosyl transferase, group 1 [Piscinibacter sakaiensis]